MIVPAATLKSVLKRLSAVKSDQFTFDTGTGLVVARDQELEVRVLSRALASPDVRDHQVLNINLRRMSSATSKLSGEVTITPSDRGITLASKRTSFTIEAAPGKVPVAIVPPTPVSLPFASVLGLLKFAAASAETNRASPFGGIVQLKSYAGFEDDGDVEYEAAGVAGGGHCLAVAKGTGFTVSIPKLHIPLAAVRALQDLDAETFELSETESLLIFRVNEGDTHIAIHASKLAKQFPEYGSFIPKQFKFIASIEPAEMKEALNSVAAMIGQDARDDAGAVFLTFKGGTVAVRTVSKTNAAEDSAPYKGLAEAGEEEYIYLLKHVHLSSFFGAAKEPVIFSGNGGNEPVVLQAANVKIVLAATILKG